MLTTGFSPAPDRESFDDLHERVLKFMGAFANMQFSMDTAVRTFLTKRLPHLGPALVEQFLSRQRDQQRLPCFIAFAEETGYMRDLVPLKRVYNRAKQTRDLIGHSLGVHGPVLHPGGPPTVGVTYLRTTKKNLVPTPLLPSTFDRLANDCGWIGAHAMRALFEANVNQFTSLTGEPVEPPIPTELPVDGEPL